jgi:hypothetical protein
MKYVIIAGGREFDDYALAARWLDELYLVQTPPSEWTVLCGMAKGADTVGRLWAEDNQIPVLRYPANWTKYGRGAGFIRNGEMAAKADMLVAFWDGESRGTKDMIMKAFDRGLQSHVIRYRRGGDGVIVRHEIIHDQIWRQDDDTVFQCDRGQSLPD